ncbi:hypothetical protein F4815DRAFT_486512 [Daldinia loculata]|nr:hypothetical protein F4815DRAFT_486512 [Daldinia loculata]
MALLLRSFLSFISAPAFFHPLPTFDPRSHNIQISFAVPQPSYLFLKTSQFIFFPVGDFTILNTPLALATSRRFIHLYQQYSLQIYLSVSVGAMGDHSSWVSITECIPSPYKISAI